MHVQLLPTQIGGTVEPSPDSLPLFLAQIFLGIIFPPHYGLNTMTA